MTRHEMKDVGLVDGTIVIFTVKINFPHDHDGIVYII